MFPTRTIPQSDPVKIRVCHPCVPKCLKIRIRAVSLTVESHYAALPEAKIREDFTFYVTLCPGGLNATTQPVEVTTGIDKKIGSYGGKPAEDEPTAPNPREIK